MTQNTQILVINYWINIPPDYHLYPHAFSKSILQSLIFTLILFSNEFLWADSTTIYKYIDENGVLHLTNIPPKNQENIVYSRSYLLQSYTPPPKKLVKKKPIDGLEEKRARYAHLITQAANAYQLSPALLHAVVTVESNYRPAVVSPKGAVGLMQLMPATARRYGVEDSTDPAQNLMGGAHYLRDLLDLFEQDVKLALAAYNAGENAVKRYDNQIPPYSETQNYVRKVLDQYHQWQLPPLIIVR